MSKKAIPTLSMFLLAFAIVGRPTPAAAADGVTVDAAYQFVRTSFAGASESFPLGFAAGVGVPLNGTWIIVGDFGWSRKSEPQGHSMETTFGGGLRFAPVTTSTFHPYLQAVAGAEDDKFSPDAGGGVSSTNFMIQPGVGAMFAMGKLSTFVEGDYRLVMASGANANNLVLRGGVVWRLGR